jgi:hypothetical protein
MEKSRIRPLIWVLFTALSLACYVYLRSVSVEETGVTPDAFSIIQQEQKEANDEESRILLPDVALVKKIINITKIVIPEK